MASTSLPNENNSLLQQFSNFGNVLAGFGKNVADVYGSFIDARTAKDLAKRQAAPDPARTSASTLSAGAIRDNKLVTIGIVAAVAGTAFLLFKGK